MPGTSFFILRSGIQHSLNGGSDDFDFFLTQAIKQGIKLPAGCGLAVCVIFKEKLIHRDMIAGNKLKENLEAWMLSLILGFFTKA